MSAFLTELSISCPDSDKGGIKEIFEVLLSFLRIENFFLLDIFGLFQTFLSDEKYLFYSTEEKLIVWRRRNRRKAKGLEKETKKEKNKDRSVPDGSDNK